MNQCWAESPAERPDFSTICSILDSDLTSETTESNSLMESNPLSKSEMLLYDDINRRVEREREILYSSSAEENSKNSNGDSSNDSVSRRVNNLEVLYATTKGKEEMNYANSSAKEWV